MCIYTYIYIYIYIYIRLAPRTRRPPACPPWVRDYVDTVVNDRTDSNA